MFHVHIRALKLHKKKHKLIIDLVDCAQTMPFYFVFFFCYDIIMIPINAQNFFKMPSILHIYHTCRGLFPLDYYIRRTKGYVTHRAHTLTEGTETASNFWLMQFHCQRTRKNRFSLGNIFRGIFIKFASFDSYYLKNNKFYNL